MTTPFGPQLIGETEKTLVALLRRSLAGTDLTEHQWVTIRLAGLLDGTVDDAGLVAAVADRAQFADAAELVEGVSARGLVADGRLTAAGRAMLETVLERSDVVGATLWADFPADDVAATERTLNELHRRARAALV